MFLSIDLVEYIYENDKMSFGCILLIIFEFFKSLLYTCLIEENSHDIFHNFFN